MTVYGISHTISNAIFGQTSDEALNKARETVREQIDYAVAVLEPFLTKEGLEETLVKSYEDLKGLVQKVDDAKNIQDLKNIQQNAKEIYKDICGRLVTAAQQPPAPPPAPPAMPAEEPLNLGPTAEEIGKWLKTPEKIDEIKNKLKDILEDESLLQKIGGKENLAKLLSVFNALFEKFKKDYVVDCPMCANVIFSTLLELATKHLNDTTDRLNTLSELYFNYKKLQEEILAETNDRVTDETRPLRNQTIGISQSGNGLLGNNFEEFEEFLKSENLKNFKDIMIKIVLDENLSTALKGALENTKFEEAKQIIEQNMVTPSIEVPPQAPPPPAPAVPAPAKSAGKSHLEGWENYRLGKHGEAVKNFEEAIKLDPKFAKAYNGLGCANYELGKHGEAVKNFEEAINLDQDYAGAYYGLSLAEGKLGKYDDAKKHYDRACELDSLYKIMEKPDMAPAVPAAPAVPETLPVPEAAPPAQAEATQPPAQPEIAQPPVLPEAAQPPVQPEVALAKPLKPEAAQPEALKLQKDTEYTINERSFTFAKGSKLYYHKNGKIKSGILAKDTKIKIGDKEVAIAKGSRLLFRGNGTLKGIFPAKDTLIEINENKILFAAKSEIYFHKNEMVASGKLARNEKIDGEWFNKRSYLKFDEDGYPIIPPPDEELANLNGLLPSALEQTTPGKSSLKRMEEASKAVTIEEPSLKTETKPAEDKETKTPLFKGSGSSSSESVATGALDPDGDYYDREGRKYTTEELNEANENTEYWAEVREDIIEYTGKYEAARNTRKQEILSREAVEKIENHILKMMKSMSVHGRGVITLEVGVYQRYKGEKDFITQKDDGSLAKPVNNKGWGKVFIKFGRYEGDEKDKVYTDSNNLADFMKTLNGRSADEDYLNVKDRLIALSDDEIAELFAFQRGAAVGASAITSYMISEKAYARYTLNIKVSGENLEVRR